MKIQLTGKNIEITPAIRTYIEEKLGGLSKYNEQVTELRVTLEHIRDQHAESFRVTAQLQIDVAHDVLFTEEVAKTAYAATDIVKDELERQLRDLKERHLTSQRKASATKRDLKSAVTE